MSQFLHLSGRKAMNPTQSGRVLQNISLLDEEQLLCILDSPDGEYTSEALGFAQAELERRGGRAKVAQEIPDNVATPKPTAALEGIAGWLILPLISLCLGLASGVMNVIELATAVRRYPQVEIGVLLIVSVGLLVFTGWVSYLFAKRHRWTPPAYIALLVTNALAGPLFSPNAPFRGVVVCAIWIPYFLTSTRVKRTFVL